jgi:hypothetical protein
VLSHVNFNTEQQVLIDLAYNDIVYAWLLIHSHYNPDEKYNYIYKNAFTYKGIANEIHKNEKTVSKRFKELEHKDIIRKGFYNGKEVYKMAYYN